MDLSKKRKTDENGGVFTESPPPNTHQLSPEDIKKILEPFTKEQLLEIVQSSITRDPLTLSAVRTIADNDPAQRKLFIRGLGWETSTEKLQAVFSGFGEVAEAIVITDKNSGKSKGYGFVTFKHIDGAVLALREPNKKIDGRVTVTQLAASGVGGGNVGGVDVSMRKIYVGNIPFEISSERLLGVFEGFGEIEEGPLGFDKQSGKAKGFAFFVYKTEEGARNSLVEPMKVIDGFQVNCKYATDGKKPRPGENVGQPGGGNPGYGYQGGVGQFGGPGQFGGGFGGGMQVPQGGHQGPMVNSGPGFGNQGPGQGVYSGPGGGGYGGNGQQFGTGLLQPGEYGGGSNNMGPGSGYRMPPSSGGVPPIGGYQDGGSYGLPSTGYGQPQLPQQSGPRGPPGGMYQGVPPHYY